MGSFNTICSVSRQVVGCGDKVVLLAMSDGQCISAMPLSAVYDDYGDFDVTRDLAFKCLLKNVSMNNEGVTEDNLMDRLVITSDEKWTVPSPYSINEHRTAITLTVIKSDVYDLVAKFGEGRWNYKKEYNTDIRRMWEVRSPEYTQRNIKRLEEQIEECKGDTEDDHLVRHMRMMISQYEMGNSLHFDLYSLCQYNDKVNHNAHHDDSTRAIFDNVDILAKLEDFFIGVSGLDIELGPQEYGSQDINQFEKVRMMTMIQVVGFNQTEKVQLTPIEWDVKVPSDMVDDSVKPNWSNEIDLIRVGDGHSLEITGSRYNEFREYRHNDVFLTEVAINDPT